MTKHVHGGDVYRHKDCLDFSANLNPLGTPESVKQAIIGSLDHIAQYPQVGCDLLREKIAEYEGVKKGRNCLWKWCGRSDFYPLPCGKTQKGAASRADFCRIRTGTGEHGL